MFIVLLNYVKSLDEVDRLVEAHVAYLDEQYAQGRFIASGRKVPRTGGVILSRMESREALEAVLAKDPFAEHGVASYEIVEFVPSKVLPGYENLQEK